MFGRVLDRLGEAGKPGQRSQRAERTQYIGEPFMQLFDVLESPPGVLADPHQPGFLAERPQVARDPANTRAEGGKFLADTAQRTGDAVLNGDDRAQGFFGRDRHLRHLPPGCRRGRAHDFDPPPRPGTGRQRAV